MLNINTFGILTRLFPQDHVWGKTALFTLSHLEDRFGADAYFSFRFDSQKTRKQVPQWDELFAGTESITVYIRGGGRIILIR